MSFHTSFYHCNPDYVLHIVELPEKIEIPPGSTQFKYMFCNNATSFVDTVKAHPKVMLLLESSNERVSSRSDKQKCSMIVKQDIFQTKELIRRTNEK